MRETPRPRSRRGEPPRPPTKSQLLRAHVRPIAARARTPAGGGAEATAVLLVRPGEPPEHLFRRCLGAYLAGAREFVLRERPSIGPGTREVARMFCRRTRQPEIVSDEGTLLRLQDIAFDSPVSLDQRLERMGRLVVDFHREAVDSWSRLPLGAEDLWDRRDDEVDREAWYIERIAARRVRSDGPRGSLLGAWTVARSLERIADHAIVLGTVGQRLADLPAGAGPATPLRQFHRQAMDHLEGALAATDGETANELLDTGAALVVSGQSLADRLLPGVGNGAMPPATAAAVARLLESIGRTVAYSQDIAQVALDRSIPLATPELLVRTAAPPEDGSGVPTSPRRARYVPVVVAPNPAP